MAAEEKYRAPHTRRRMAVVGVAVAAVLVASFIFLKPAMFDGANQAATPPSTGLKTLRPTVAIPASQIAASCPPTELKLSGVFNECAAVDNSESCMKGSWTFLMHGTAHDFLIYIEMDGAYHGPGTYALSPWPNAQVNDPDGVAKVMVREYVTGQVWQSSAGSLTIDNIEDSGWVYAGLGASQNSPVQVDLNIAGWWACS